MNQLFEYFLNNYLDGDQFDNKDKGYHKVLVDKIPDYIRSLFNDKYKVKGSCGASNKAEVPWIGLFDPSVTTTAQYGIYIVYLFRADMKGFYLCLGQGITHFEKYGKDKDVIMYQVSDYFKNKIDTSFDKNKINLNSKTSNGKLYEKVNILNKYYDLEKIDTYNFEKDLTDMVKIYDEIVNELKYQSYDEVIENLLSFSDPNYITEKEAIELIEKEIINESKNVEEEITTLINVKIPNGKKETRYSEISKKTIRKTDYMKKQKKNADNGLIGERLVMAYEEEKLKRIGREDLIEKIKWVSKENDGTGYDIISFDESGSEIYIEVKSTESSDNTAFFISANEVDVMNKLKNKYFIYRVYNLKTKNPKFFILDYDSFKKKIQLCVDSYIATLKEEIQ